MSRPTDTTPFVYRRPIRWADTDAAAIAYTARIPEFCMEALEAWFRERLGIGWYEMNRDLGIGTPFVHLSVDFRAPLTPRDGLAIRVLVRRVGGASVRFALEGRIAEGGRLAFEGNFVCSFVEAAAMKPIPIPEAYRPALEREAAIGAALRAE